MPNCQIFPVAAPDGVASSLPLLSPRLLRHVRGNHGSVAKNARHAFAVDHAMVIHQARSVYTYIPKNACSMLRFAVARANGCIVGAEDIGWIHANNASFRAGLAGLATARHSFVILRCPYRRAISVFLDKIVGTGPDLRCSALVQPKWRRLFATPDRARITFRAFLERLRDPRVLQADHHWIPQVQFLVYETYDEVFRVEDIDAARASLRQSIGLEVTDVRALTRHGTESFKRIAHPGAADLSGRAIDAMRAAGQMPRPVDFLDDGTRALIEALYGEDIALYAAHFGKQALLSAEV